MVRSSIDRFQMGSAERSQLDVFPAMEHGGEHYPGVSRRSWYLDVEYTNDCRSFDRII